MLLSWKTNRRGKNCRDKSVEKGEKDDKGEEEEEEYGRGKNRIESECFDSRYVYTRDLHIKHLWPGFGK